MADDLKPTAAPDEKTLSETTTTTITEVEGGELETAHPRHGMPVWKWPATLAILVSLTLINGYDVSNVANIQPEIYKAFGQIETLPWIGLSYSASCVAVLPFARKLCHCFDIRHITMSSLVIFAAGAAVAGAAQNMSSVIVGRIVMGIGGGIAQQCVYSYVAIFTTAVESPRVTSVISAAWALGLIAGGPIGTAFSENKHTTWRWALYINIPIVALGFAMSIPGLPSHSVAHDIPLARRLIAIDPLGLALHAASIILFCLATTFSGAIWPWNDGRTITLWVVFGLVFISYILQQGFALFTKPDERAFPTYLLSNRRLIPLWIATTCAGCAYAILLYYMPLYFAFARGANPIEQTVKLLLFILVFIVSVVVAGALLPIVGRYSPFYFVAGFIVLAGGATLTTTLDTETSDAQVMGLEAFLGLGLGLFFAHGSGLSNVILSNNRERVDSLAVFNISQLGGIAVALSIAGCVYHNLGFKLLEERLGDKHSEHDIREALAGVSSKMLDGSDPEALRVAVETVTEIMATEFYLLVAAGGICILCSLGMKWEKLDFRRNKAKG